MKKKNNQLPRCDSASTAINKLILKIPKVGALLSRLYLWRYMTFNFMFVGATGMVLSWALYEGLLRSLLIGVFGGTFLGMLITTIIVFFWNYIWNKNWSLSIDAQILAMKKGELKDLEAKVKALLVQEFDEKGNRIHEKS